MSSQLPFHDKGRTQLHFVGIGGIGMSGIAEVFLNQGYRVSGSDLTESDSTRRLRELGANVRIGHESSHITGSSVVVISSAVRADNPEVLEAKRLRIPVIPRAEMLGELMRGRTGIAVAGSHGKTTTTSMLATVLTEAGLDPTLVIGGKVDSLGGNAKLGQGSFLVAEADESDGSFLHLPATFAVVTNIDNDHLDHFKQLSAIEDAFVSFVDKLPFYGMAALCGEDPGVQRCLSRFIKPVVTYGFSRDWDYSVADLSLQGLGSRFTLLRRDAPGEEHRKLMEVELKVPGRHNALNAVAAIVIAQRLGLDAEVIRAGLKAFGGVKRRFEIRWRDESARQAIVDDYGHHPTEIAATLAAARAFWPGRIITVFQPHRYSRTINCREGFLTAFSQTDVLLMSDVYAAGEDPIEGASAQSLCRSIEAGGSGPKQRTQYVGSLESARSEVLKLFSPGDLILCMGAGSITRLPDQLTQAKIPTQVVSE
jgi:UDP-N-acetylmuramate--alanine ligase